MATLENVVYNIAESISRARGKEPAINVGTNSISIEFVNPENTESRAWDNDLYAFGNIFLEGYANALKISQDKIEESETKLMPSKKYRNFMKNKVIQDAFYADARQNKKLILLLMASLGMNVITLFAVLAVAG